VKFAHAGRSDPRAIDGGGRILENYAFLDVTLRLPEIAGVRFINVNDVESDMIAILLVKFVERGNLPAKGRSGIAAEDEHYWLLAAKRRKSDRAGAVEQRKSEIRCWATDSKMAAASLFPHGFKGKQQERYWAHVLHNASEFVRRLVHGPVEETKDQSIGDGEHGAQTKDTFFPTNEAIMRGCLAREANFIHDLVFAIHSCSRISSCEAGLELFRVAAFQSRVTRRFVSS